MRGTRAQPGHFAPPARLIPTYAGNTFGKRTNPSPSGAHPHVCGEHIAGMTDPTTGEGSSPRMRGTRCPGGVEGARAGLIPTYAGNTTVHPRLLYQLGAHPHVCGEHMPPLLSCAAHPGSSPRMRGTRMQQRSRESPHGLIPTYAGNTVGGIAGRAGPWAHPHVCGEHKQQKTFSRCLVGSSPRMRGTHLLTWGFIPTHQVLELVWSPKPVLTLHDFWAYRRRETRLYLLALLHPFRGPRSSFGADGRIMSFTPSKSTGSHG